MGVCQIIDPPVRPQIGWTSANGLGVLVITVEKGSEPLYYVDSRAYIRHGTVSRPATASEVRAALTASMPGEAAEGPKNHPELSALADVLANVQKGVAAGKDLNSVYKDTYAALKPKYGSWVIFDHCMPFDVTRCYDEVTQYTDPRIWTAERDVEMWKSLEGQ